MGLLELTSAASLWRVYDYYKANKVHDLQALSDTVLTSTVDGSDNNRYDITIDLEHPRISKCNCPHADGKRIICKHMVATYFKVRPFEADRIYREYITHQEEEEQRQEELENKLLDHVEKMSRSELQNALLQVLFDGPEWQYEKFIREYAE